MIELRKKRVLKKKFKYFLTIYTVFLLAVLVVNNLSNQTTESKYRSVVNKNGNVQVAKPIVTIENDTTNRNIVNGSKVIKYFNVTNYDGNVTTDVAMDYYIQVVDGEDNVISDARVFYQTYDDDPNDFTEITKETSGTYNGYFKGISFTTARKSQGYKLVIDKVIDYDEVDVQVVAVQKEVSN